MGIIWVVDISWGGQIRILFRLKQSFSVHVPEYYFIRNSCRCGKLDVHHHGDMPCKTEHV